MLTSTGPIVPIGTLLAWLCLGIAGCAVVGGLLYTTAYGVTRALVAAGRRLTTAATAIRSSVTTPASPTQGTLPVVTPAVLPAAGVTTGDPAHALTGHLAPSTRGRAYHLDPLIDAVDRGATALSGVAQRWFTAAGGDQPSPAATRRALAEVTVTALFWLIASVSDLQLTFARLAGAGTDLSAAYASSDTGIAWTTAFVFVGTIGTFASALLATTGMAGHTILVPEPERRTTRRLLYGFLGATMLAAVALALAAQEEVDNVHDVALWDVCYGLLAISLFGTLWQGAFAGRTVIALGLALGSTVLWLPLAGVLLVLRVVRGVPPVPAPPDGAAALIASAAHPAPSTARVALPSGRRKEAP